MERRVCLAEGIMSAKVSWQGSKVCVFHAERRPVWPGMEMKAE